MNQDGWFEMDLVLRNNRTSEEHPLGIFHPHAHLHHIKKENIGLIEVMGLAILPARLQVEFDELGDNIVARLILQDKITAVFAEVLENAGVFKWDEVGKQQFDTCMCAFGFV